MKATPGADTPASREAYRTLQQACLDQGPCACAQFGDALTLSSEPTRQLQGLDHLEDACKAGVLDACDEGLLLASLCAVESEPAYCDALRRAGVVPEVEPEPVWREVALPAELLGCREGLVESGVVMPCPEIVGVECHVGQSDHPKLAVCVEAARILWKADDWDVKTVRWETQAAGVWRAIDARGDVVLSLMGKGGEIQLRTGDAVLRRVPPTRANVLQQEIAKLPTTQEMCVAAAACRRALDEVVKERGDALDLEGEAIEDSLSTCREALNEARVQLEAVNPELASQRCPHSIVSRQQRTPME